MIYIRQNFSALILNVHVPLTREAETKISVIAFQKYYCSQTLFWLVGLFI